MASDVSEFNLLKTGHSPLHPPKKNLFSDWWGKVGLRFIIVFQEVTLWNCMDFKIFQTLGIFLKNNSLLWENLSTLPYKAELLLIIVEPGLLTLRKEALSSTFQCGVNLVCD